MIQDHSKALVVFSGGQDSTTCLYWAMKNFKKVLALTFDYEQTHSVEIKCAQEICAQEGVEHKIIKLDVFKDIAQNALTDNSIEAKDDGGMQGLPSTFVPGRNAIFLSVASSVAVSNNCTDVVTGVCETDYSGYPDCRNDFVRSIEKSMSLALGQSLEIHTPLMFLTKAETFEMASSLKVLDKVIKKSHTCYVGDRSNEFDWGFGCGECPACLLRKKGFEDWQKSKQEMESN